jgi:hypothetical protein
MGYCTRKDVFAWLPPAGVPNPAREIASINVPANTFALNSHHLSDGDAVSFRTVSGGKLPEPIETEKTYFVSVISESLFAVTESIGGPFVHLTSSGHNVLMMTKLPWDEWIDAASNEADCLLPEHIVPIQPDIDTGKYPAILVEFTAGLVAEKAMIRCAGESDAIRNRIDRLRTGLGVWGKERVKIRGVIEPRSAVVSILWKNNSRTIERTLP